MKKSLKTQQAKNELTLILFRLTHFYCQTQDYILKSQKVKFNLSVQIQVKKRKKI